MSVINWLSANYQTLILAVWTVLGGIVMLLKPISAFTKWTGDNWVVAKLESLMHWIARLFLPEKLTSLGGGKGGDGQA